MSQTDANQSNIVDAAVAEGGAYEVIRKRLISQGDALYQEAKQLNQARIEEFGSTDMSVVARVRVRTENNCIARDIVQVGEHLLFGYNVFIGLKKETKIEDVFSLFDVVEGDDGISLEPADCTDTFLRDQRFVGDFEELYRYYKHAKLLQLRVINGKLLAGFQIGEKLDDVRVFRWSVSSDGKTVEYIDNRGERDIELPSPYDFEWMETSRDDVVHGSKPYLNILDTLFVQTHGGALRFKIEDNSEAGEEIHQEPLEDETQSLDDSAIAYAKVGSLILIRLLPYREEVTRFFVFNTLTDTIARIDAIGESCVQLPEDHGIIFPGGYYLQSGEHKRFPDNVEGLQFKRMFRSPNGEDVLFVFYEPEQGINGLFSYNLINKSLQNPIYGNGWALAECGRLVIFSAEEEPTRVHPMQIWQTPFQTAEYASKAPVSQTFYGRIGNAELVRGVSDLYSICRIIEDQTVSVRLYEELSKNASRMFDDHYWLEESEVSELGQLIKEIQSTSELVIDEFEKVESIRKQSLKTMREAEESQQELLIAVRPDNWETPEQYVKALSLIRQQRGHLTTIREHRYIDLPRIDEMDSELEEIDARLSQQTVEFLSEDKSLDPYLTKIDEINADIDKASTKAMLAPILESVDETSSGLDLLSDLMSSLKVDDATIRTRIIDAISSVYSKLNQTKATATLKTKNLGSEEAIAQFGAQFKLLSQSITNALGLSTTPEKCDEQLSRLLVQLEDLESQFGDFDQFLSDIMDKREEIYESFETHKQKLLDEQQRKAQSLTDAASRILASIEKRSMRFTEADELNTYFAADSLVLKIKDLVQGLRDLDAAVKADDIDARFKSTKEQALRSLRDKTDIYEEGGNVIKLGPRHKFSVNTQELDLTIIPRDDSLNIHLTGTDYFEPIENEQLNALRDYWDLSLESESPAVYRAEYLAYLMLEAAKNETHDLSLDLLMTSYRDEDALSKLVRDFATPRYKESYEKGVHDHDATLLLKALLPVLEQAELLRFNPVSRAFAQLFYSHVLASSEDQAKSWIEQAKSSSILRTAFGSYSAFSLLTSDIHTLMCEYLREHSFDFDAATVYSSSQYLAEELSREQLSFVQTTYSAELISELKRSVDQKAWTQFQSAIKKLSSSPTRQWKFIHSWLDALLDGADGNNAFMARYIPEATASLMAESSIAYRTSNANLDINVEGLLGDHKTIDNQTLSFALDDFLQRLAHHCEVVIPAYRDYLHVRQKIIHEERAALRLQEFKARPLSSFVRNRLINESYLPLIGDNLAKQMGTVGEDKRTDLMGLLMMISPPGYGKTTLMEYVANRLGLIFMKINCPSLGHDVMSLDPEQAPNATARQELEKLNLGLEMGNNVMLYLDDIQHTHPEFLQKFISLCDGTRRIEGVWKGRTKTYDMRGKKFCVIMAGNPYTESGEAFKVPDMLANRADIYNLGDILGGMDEQFALSYIENGLTSNKVTAPLATREMSDVYKLIDMAKGKNLAATDLSHQYSGAEINEITEVLRKMFVIQDVVLKINKQYIASAAQNDKYRTEPSFKLQGSYRNMNKMSEKLSAVMNEDELLQMVQDHYLGEAQLLTTGAEDNLLKLAELRGNMTEEQSKRWEQIKSDFLRNKAMGDDSDVGGRVVAQLLDVASNIKGLSDCVNGYIDSSTQEKESNSKDKPADILSSKQFSKSMDKLITSLSEHRTQIDVVNQPVPGIDKILHVLADTIEHSLMPVVKSMDKKIDIDLGTHRKLVEVSNQLRRLESQIQTDPDSTLESKGRDE